LARVFRVGGWDELPDVLEPGVYDVSGERLIVYERVSKRSLKRTLEIMGARGGTYV